MRKVLLFYKKLAIICIPVSLMTGLIGTMMFHDHLDAFIKAFTISMFSGSYFLGLFYFEKVHGQTYYFYYNMGYSKAAVIVYAYLLQLPLVLLFLL